MSVQSLAASRLIHHNTKKQKKERNDCVAEDEDEDNQKIVNSSPIALKQITISKHVKQFSPIRIDLRRRKKELKRKEKNPINFSVICWRVCSENTCEIRAVFDSLSQIIVSLSRLFLFYWHRLSLLSTYISFRGISKSINNFPCDTFADNTFLCVGEKGKSENLVNHSGFLT